MDDIRVAIDSREVARAFERAPAVMVRSLRGKLSRAGMEVAREARSRAPEAFGTLRQSIRSRLRPGAALEVEVAPGVQYAAYVEEGTGRGGSPSIQGLIAWIRRKRIEPRTPGMSEEDLAYVIARAIRARGTPKQPFLEPAARAKEDRVRALIEQGVAQGLAEAFR